MGILKGETDTYIFSDCAMDGGPLSMVEELNLDTVQKIFEYLKFDDVCRISRVCSFWYQCASIQFFRREVFKR